jgi:Lipoprotein LpqB beta-propeller domain/Sporulation and spore germination
MRRPASALVLVVAGGLLSGCVGIPSSGPVHQGGAIVESNDDPFTRIVAQPPVPGMTAQQEVEGFLHASASFDDDHAVARMFLTTDAARAWNADAGATVYDDSGQAGPVRFSVTGQDVVKFSGPQTGRITPQGEFLAAAKGATASATFRLVKVARQWRIASLAPGLLLTTNDVGRAYRSFNVYFPDPSRTVVVPEQVLVPVGPGISTSLVRAVLAGPTPWLSPAVSSAVPTGTRLVVDSAPITDGSVLIDLTAPAAGAVGREAAAMSAQFVWTLRQLSSVTTLRITVEGVPLRVPGVGDTQSIQGWSEFDPDSGSADSNAYAVSQGKVVLVKGNQPQAIAGPFGDGSVQVAHPASSFDQTQLAGLDLGGGRLLVVRSGPGTHPVVALTGSSLTPPSWDRLGAVWTADRGPGGNTVWDVTLGSAPRKVSVQDLPKGTILGLRLARDGVRVAVLLRAVDGVSDVYLGRVERADSKVSLAGFQLVNTGFAQTTDFAWESADRLVVLGRDKPADVLQPWLVDLSGTRVQAFGTVTGGTEMASVTAAPTRPVLASTVDGRLWWYSGFEWDPLGTASSPSYPG